jgi:hypothetical protein
MTGDPTMGAAAMRHSRGAHAPYGQVGSGEGKVVPAMLFDQQLPVPERSQARSTVNTDGTDGSGYSRSA